MSKFFPFFFLFYFLKYLIILFKHLGWSILIQFLPITSRGNLWNDTDKNQEKETLTPQNLDNLTILEP